MKNIKTFARYERVTRDLYMGSPELSHDELHQFLKTHSFMDIIPIKWWRYIIPGDSYTFEKDSEGNEFVVKRYTVLFPLSFLLLFKSQREKFSNLFYEFKYEKF